MEGLGSILGAVLKGNNAKQISSKVDASEGQVQDILSSAVPVLVAAMTKNSSTTSGANALQKALEQHEKDNDKISGNIDNIDVKDGENIIHKILGKNEDNAIATIAKKSGASKSDVSSVLAYLAPMLLSLVASNLLGGNKKDEGNDLSSMLGGLLTGSGSSSGGLLGNIVGGLLGGSDDNSSNAKKDDNGMLGDIVGSLLGGNANGNADGKDDGKNDTADLIGGLIGNLLK